MIAVSRRNEKTRCVRLFIGVFIGCFRFLEKELLERRARRTAFDNARAGTGCETFDFLKQLRRSILDYELRLLLDAEEVVERSFADQNTIRENPDAIANFLHLSEQMRREQDGDPATFQRQNQVADLACAGGIDACRRLVEHKEFWFL